MMERVRILLVAVPGAPIRALAHRLDDPDIQVMVCGSAREALERLGGTLPTVVALDGSLPHADVIRLYGRLRASVLGANVPILFTSHDESNVDLERTTAPDFYIGPEATLDDVEQLLFTFLPEALFEEAEPEPQHQPPPPERSAPVDPPAPGSEP
jgi:CheY-like chemotaxis protein